MKGKGKPGGGGGGGGKGAAAPREMASGDTSKTWASSRANYISVGTDFLKYTAEHDEELATRWGTSWVNVPEAEACSREIFSRLATYLAEVHTIKEGRKKAGSHFDSSTAEACWSDLVQGNRQRFSSSTEEATRVRRLPRACAARLSHRSCC